MASLASLIRTPGFLPVCTGMVFRLFITLSLAVLSACAVTPPQIQSVIVNDSVVDGSTNEVQVTRAGAAQPAARGTNLEVGDVISTGPDSQAVLLLENGAVEVIVLENSEIRISSIFVTLGEVFVRVKEKLTSTFEVKSEYGVAGVEGTEFIVSVQRGVDYRCVTLEGKVAVRSARGSWPGRSVPARQEFTVNSGAQPQQRTLNRAEYNSLVSRVNRIERIYRPRSTQFLVPDVSGMMEADARRVLQSQNLVVGEVSGRVTSRAPVGEVLSQVPAAGLRIRPRTAVKLEVEAQPTTVPNVTRSTLDAAVESLKKADLNEGKVTTEVTGKNKAGIVFQQQPRAGARVPVNSDVDLWVEAESRRVPRMVNVTIDNARQLLADNELQVGNVEEKLVEGKATGTVLEQSVAANKLVLPNTRIDLVVAERGIRVPNLVNNTRANASRVLSGRGLKLGRAQTRPSRSTTGNVIEQSPSAGTLMKPGSQVSIVLAGQCRVPNVKGMTFSSASAAISGADLVPRKRRTGNYDITKVYGQSPAPNSSVRCGTTVHVDMGDYVIQ